MLSKNAGSSRAIPVKKVIEKIQADPYIPQFTKNQKGMQGAIADKLLQEEAELVWFRAMDTSIEEALRLDKLGIHKQNVNRLLEPWMYVPVIITGTEWENFFNLRCGEATHPDFRAIAWEMKGQYDSHVPHEIRPGQWHIPMSEGLAKSHGSSTMKFTDALKVATARHARLSYATHDGEFSFDRDVSLHDGLVKDQHKSPFEHSAMAVSQNSSMPGFSYLLTGELVNTRNYRGWFSYRGHLEDSIDV
jgi:hypothetical protein